MITYVNSVFVSNVAENNIVSALANVTKGKFIFWDIDANAAVSANTVRFKIGMGTGKTLTNDKGSFPEIKWSNIINVDDIKGWTAHTAADDTEDVVTVNFRSITQATLNKLAEGDKRLIIRITYKDLPTRYRKWTESYEYVTKVGNTANDIVKEIVNMINNDQKRARVIASLATATAGASDGDPDTIADTAAGSEDQANTIKLTAMKYDDDNSVDSINWYNKVRFNVNVYYTDPDAEGWASLNKNYPAGVEIVKTPGKTDQGSAKLVRDREAQSFGYLGILNRGEGTWPIIQPTLNTQLFVNDDESTPNKYNVVTLEFENMYRAADDIFRKTKQTVEIYTKAATSGITTVLSTLAGDTVDNTIE